MTLEEAHQRLSREIWSWLAEGPPPEDDRKDLDLEALQMAMDALKGQIHRASA